MIGSIVTTIRLLRTANHIAEALRTTSPIRTHAAAAAVGFVAGAAVSRPKVFMAGFALGSISAMSPIVSKDVTP